MSGLLVKIRSSRRHWRVTSDDGTTLTLEWNGEQGTAARSDVTARNEPGIGWIATEISA
jgi:hypothetical protein